MDILLNRVFTAKELDSLVKYKSMKYVEKATERYGITSKDLATQIKDIYAYLGNHHRNEYFYKNQLLNNIVLGRHSPNTTSALREVPVANSIADFLVMNGKAQVYEIKTELDTLQRLNRQIDDYYKAFSYVNVITDKKYVNKIKKIVNQDVGIFTLTNRNQIHIERKPQLHSQNLDSKVLFKLLRKPEFEKINKEKFGELPKVGASKYYDANYRLFSTLSVSEQQKSVTFALKQRNLNRFKGKATLLKECPKELRELIYFSKLKDQQIETLINILKMKEG
ncbi:sce7726 family protein [Lactobacillus isalae]|uniref:sce7726 family protein n=1 Tax=Lactobacillus isalae TaxID=2993455 RepID=UPI0024A8028A|nr:sce7726 family protein [Lactobacillus isalae]